MEKARLVRRNGLPIYSFWVYIEWGKIIMQDLSYKITDCGPGIGLELKRQIVSDLPQNIWVIFIALDDDKACPLSTGCHVIFYVRKRDIKVLLMEEEEEQNI